jgi:hypothetical protein
MDWRKAFRSMRAVKRQMVCWWFFARLMRVKGSVA